MADVRALAKPLPAERSVPALVDRPIVLDFEDHQVQLGYRFRHDEVLRPAAVPGFPALVLDDQRVERLAILEYRRRLGDSFEAGIRLPWANLQESLPTRISPLAVPPLFTASEAVRQESGLGDVELFVARAYNRPGLSRRLGLDVKLDNARSKVPDEASLPLGTGQRDFALSYGLKQTRGSFAVTGTAGVKLRTEGDSGTFDGGTVRYDPGDELFASVRADRQVESWWTASLTLQGLTSKRDSVNQAEQAGSSRQLVSLTPSFTFQASPVLEVVAEVELPLVAHNVPDTALFGAALRWRH
jgi:hypothetical protein